MKIEHDGAKRSPLATCCLNAAIMLEMADDGTRRDLNALQRIQKANRGQAQLLREAANLADALVLALLHAQEALAWHDAEGFEVGGKIVGDVVRETLAKSQSHQVTTP
jgi:hypothetical protein